jgi:hypothetical protein
MEMRTYFDEDEWAAFSDSIMKAAMKFLKNEKVRHEMEALRKRLEGAIEQASGSPPVSRITIHVHPRVSTEDHEKAGREGIPHLDLEIRASCPQWHRHFWYKTPPHAILKMEAPRGDSIVYLPEAPWTTWILEGDTHGISRDEIMGRYAYKSEAIPMIRSYLDRIGFLEAQVKPRRNGHEVPLGSIEPAKTRETITPGM